MGSTGSSISRDSSDHVSLLVSAGWVGDQDLIVTDAEEEHAGVYVRSLRRSRRSGEDADMFC